MQNFHKDWLNRIDGFCKMWLLSFSQRAQNISSEEHASRVEYFEWP
jgi:hypothetical protein